MTTGVVRAALVQTTWTGDKESMIKAHEDYARDAAVTRKYTIGLPTTTNSATYVVFAVGHS